METLNSIINTCELTRGNSGVMAYYSHLIPVVLSMFLAIFVLRKAKFNLFSRVFFAFIFSFSLWLIGDLILWTQNNYFLQYASWAPLVFIELVFFVFGLYFALLFIKRSDITTLTKVPLFLFLIPPFIVTILGLSVTGFNYPVCESYNNNNLDIYKLIVEIILLLVFLYYIVKSYFNRENLKNRRTNLIVLSSMFLFLLIFGGTEYYASITGVYEYNLYSLLLLPVFLLVIIYAVFELDIFRFKMLGTQYLVVGLVILITGQLFFVNGSTDRLLTILTVILTVGLSIVLYRNLERETDQRLHIEKLSEMLKFSKTQVEETNTKLQTANEKLKGLDKLKTEFVSLASHQLRSPLTAIKGYASMLEEGDYGDINPEAKDAVNRIFESSQNLAKIVEDLLNVSKIEQGGMKYEMAEFDLGEVASSMCKDLSVVAENKGLKLTYLSEGIVDCIVNGDKDKIRQVVLNFIDNSIKYTKNGEIKVKVEKKDSKVLFSVSDTGMGMSPEIRDTLFHKFARGEGARMNTSGSGLGLYLTKEITKAHGGRVWAESEGMGMGSTFFMELDALK